MPDTPKFSLQPIHVGDRFLVNGATWEVIEVLPGGRLELFNQVESRFVRRYYKEVRWQKMVDTSLGILRGMNERIDLIEGIIDTVIALRDEVVRLQGHASIVGAIKVLRSEGKDAENCKCCEGRHAYSRWFNFDEYIDFHDWITQQFQFPSLEGRKVQITATLLPENQ